VVWQVAQPLSGVDELALVGPSWAIGPLISPVDIDADVIAGTEAVAAGMSVVDGAHGNCERGSHFQQTQST
jgi:hypothetical protein